MNCNWTRFVVSLLAICVTIPGDFTSHLTSLSLSLDTYVHATRSCAYGSLLVSLIFMPLRVGKWAVSWLHVGAYGRTFTFFFFSSYLLFECNNNLHLFQEGGHGQKRAVKRRSGQSNGKDSNRWSLDHLHTCVYILVLSKLHFIFSTNSNTSGTKFDTDTKIPFHHSWSLRRSRNSGRFTFDWP